MNWSTPAIRTTKPTAIGTARAPTRLEYDQPSSLFAQFHDERIAAVAATLDEKMGALVPLRRYCEQCPRSLVSGPSAGFPIYSANKSEVIALTKSTALEFAAKGGPRECHLPRDR